MASSCGARALALAVLLVLGLLPGVPPPLAASEAQVAYTVVLEALSAGKRLAAARPKDMRRARRRVDAASLEILGRAVARTQEPVVAGIEAAGATVLGSVRNVLNAVFVRATPAQAEQIAQIEGVRRVVRSRTLELQLDQVGRQVGLPVERLRPDGTTATGRGIKIGIIDSGLDFGHEAFQDDFLPRLDGYPKGRPAHLRFASSKVVALRSYMHLQNSGDPATSTPDDQTPRDTSGHGTSVAMIAAGRRVSTPAGMIEGIAPEAYLGIYKVTGTLAINPGTTSNAVIAAIDDAVVDGMDIVNLSLAAPSQFPWNAYGSECGHRNPLVDCEPIAVAAQSAVRDFGLVVVAAAGNSGDQGWQEHPAKNTVTSPALAPDVIAVGATVHARRLVQGVRVRGRPSTLYTALSGTGPDIESDLTARLAVAADLGNGRGCDPYAAGALEGRVALIERGDCLFLVKVEHAAAAGAVAVLVYSNEESDALFEMAGLDGTDVPAYFLRMADGAALSRESAATVLVEAELKPEPHDPWRVASFSSRGPTPGLILKPDIVAPGAHVYSAKPRRAPASDAYTLTGYGAATGTSLAAPVVAGAAALIWQTHPYLNASEVASALINTASQSITEDGSAARVGSVGGGLLNIEQALEPIATVEPPTVSFGAFGAQDLPVVQEIWVTNRALSEQSYRIVVEPRDPDQRAAVTVDGLQQVEFSLPTDTYQALAVALEGLPPAPGSYEGHLRISRQSGGQDLLVPYLYVVGDGAPHNSFAVSGAYEVGPEGERAVRGVRAKFVDRYGAPAAGAPVSFRVQAGTGRVLAADRGTGPYGVAAARVEWGSEEGEQTISAASGELGVDYRFEANVSRPRIDLIVNGASLEANRPVAPGSIATVFGAGFTEFAGAAPAGAALLSLKAASASFDFPEQGLSVPAPLLFANEGEISLQIPWEFAGLNFVYVKVRAQSGTGEVFGSAPIVLDLADAAPGIFTVRAAGGREVPLVEHPNGILVTSDFPARPGGTVRVFMTGNGPLVDFAATGEAPQEPVPTVHQPTATVGGARAAVSNSSAVPGLVGAYQVDLAVPTGLSPGDHALQVTVAGSASNSATLPVQ